MLPVLLAVSVSCATLPERDAGSSAAQPVVLVLIDELTWEKVEETPSLEEAFSEGAVANLSTAQGTAPTAPRMGYVLLGAGSRVDTSLLPEDLPEEPTEVPEAFGGPASSIEPGLLGEALSEAGVETATIGRRAKLVVLDPEDRDLAYEGSQPVEHLEDALSEGAEFVAVDARSPEEAGRISAASQETGATVAIASPNAPNGSASSANLTPFVLSGLGESLLYSPTTRTRGLITSADVAPTLLARLGVEPPAEMQGRAAAGVAGAEASAERLDGRLSFVAERRFAVWLLVGLAMVLGTSLVMLWRGVAGAVYALLVLAALPAGALAVAAAQVTNAPIVAALTVLFAGALAALCRRLSGSVAGAVAGVFLVTAALILADAASGGMLMKFSTLGYNPAYGTRFYGIGNEYAAFLAGSLTVGLGALSYRRRLPLVPLLVVGLAAVFVLGLPTMGADVGGSLALGLGFGATVGLLRGARLRGMVLWSSGGLAGAAALFLVSGALFPGVSHGSRAAGGETDLVEVAVRKLLLSLDLLLNPVFLPILALGLVVVFLGWRRTRGTALGAGLAGATITALASGALNDSGILATIYALAYPLAAAAIFLLSNPNKTDRVR